MSERCSSLLLEGGEGMCKYSGNCGLLAFKPNVSKPCDCLLFNELVRRVSAHLLYQEGLDPCCPSERPLFSSDELREVDLKRG